VEPEAREPWLPGSAWTLLLSVVALSMLGIVGIYIGEAHAEGGPVSTLRQTAYLAASLIAFIMVVAVGYQRLSRWAYVIYWVTIVLLVLLLVAKKVPLAPLIVPRRNAYRWIVFGPVQLQVSEIAKIACVLALAAYLRFKDSHRSLRGLLATASIALLPTGLVLLEPDLGTSLLFIPVFLAMVFAAGARVRHLAMLIGCGAAAAVGFYFSPLMSPYQKVRVQAVLRQNEENQAWHMAAGYQLRQSKIAIGSGGVAGAGLEPSPFFRHGLLPEEHNDFIFAVLAHQWGFAGATAIIACYVVALVTCLVIGSGTPDPFGRLVAVGVAALIFAQTTINIAMTVGLAPITGMTLPFVSFGGSSLVANYVAVGLVCSVARRRPILVTPRPCEFEDEATE
jgi:rod shape determining protein RodA